MRVNPKVSSHIPIAHGGPFSRKYSSSALDFSSNVNPLGIPQFVRNSLKNNLRKLQIYPDSDSIQLRKNLQKYTKINYMQIVVGNGATEIIYNFCMAFVSKKTSILIPVPTFGEYEAAVKLMNGKISFFKTLDLEKDIKNFLKKIPINGGIFICNPNNPTGILISKKFLRKIISIAKKRKTFVFVDECFIELSPRRNESIINLVKGNDNLFILRSLAKSFALAGLRIGYGISSKKIISILNKIKIPWNVSGIAQDAASLAISNPSYLKIANRLIEKESRFLHKEISKLNNFQCNNSSTNFILINTKIKSNLLQNKLLKKKILVRDCSSIRGLNKNCIRIAVKTHKENKKLIKALKEI